MSKSKLKFKLGDRVQYTAVLLRSVDYHAEKKTWGRQDQRVTRTGIVVGFRTLQDGRIEYLSYEEGNAWVRTGSVPAYMVAQRIEMKPDLVPPDAITLMSETSDHIKNPIPPNSRELKPEASDE